MRYIELRSTNPHYNMAFEAWAIKNLPQGETYFYLWRNAPAVIVGENQNVYAEVNLDFLKSNGITLARRTTGGGAVYHDLNNLNYSFIGEDVSVEPIVQALRSLGVQAEITGRNDIFVDGRKVSGYAKRLENGRSLVHGTLMFDVDLSVLQRALDTPFSKMNVKGVKSVKSKVANLKDYLPQCSNVEQFKNALLNYFGTTLEKYYLRESQKVEIQSICDIKFSATEWNYGKRPDALITRKETFSCGTIEVRFLLDAGVISQLAFAGDFLGGKSAVELAEKLKGLPYEREAISNELKQSRVEDYFDGVSADQLTSLIISDTLG